MEEGYTLKILHIEQVTHDVKRFRIEKPAKYKFIPGQACDVAIDKDGWREKQRPFTLTCLHNEPFLEFTIKIYTAHHGVTNELGKLNEGDSLIITDPWGAIQYKGGGVFIAGGAGITPFIAILRNLRSKKNLNGNTLLFSNKTEKDIILHEEFDAMSKEGLRVVYTLTRESNDNHHYGRIDGEFLRNHIRDFNQYFYICGPIRMVGELQRVISNMGAHADAIVVET